MSQALFRNYWKVLQNIRERPIPKGNFYERFGKREINRIVTVPCAVDATQPSEETISILKELRAGLSIKEEHICPQCPLQKTCKFAFQQKDLSFNFDLNNLTHLLENLAVHPVTVVDEKHYWLSGIRVLDVYKGILEDNGLNEEFLREIERHAKEDLAVHPKNARPERKGDSTQKRDRSERTTGDRPERPERTERTERPERTERTDRPERTERSYSEDRKPRYDDQNRRSNDRYQQNGDGERQPYKRYDNQREYSSNKYDNKPRQEGGYNNFNKYSSNDRAPRNNDRYDNKSSYEPRQERNSNYENKYESKKRYEPKQYDNRERKFDKYEKEVDFENDVERKAPRDRRVKDTEPNFEEFIEKREEHQARKAQGDDSTEEPRVGRKVRSNMKFTKQ